MQSSRPVLTIEVVWKRAWDLVKERWGSLLAVLVLQVLVSIVITNFSNSISDAVTPFFSAPLKMISLSPLAPLVPVVINYAVSLLIFPITSLLQAYASVGAIKVLLDILRGEPFRWSRLFKHGLLEWAYMVALANVLFYLTSIGFMFLLVPGMVLSLGFTLSGLILIDKGLDPVQSMKESWHLMSGQKMFLMLNYFVVGIAMTVGTLLCFVGLFPAIMVSMLIAPLMYDILDQAPASAATPWEPTQLTSVPSVEPSGVAADIDPDSDTDTDVETDSEETSDPDPSQTS